MRKREQDSTEGLGPSKRARVHLHWGQSATLSVPHWCLTDLIFNSYQQEFKRPVEIAVGMYPRCNESSSVFFISGS